MELSPGRNQTNKTFKTMEEMKKEHFHNAYKFCGKDPVRTARLLGISRATVFRILAQNRKEIEEMCK